MDKLMPVAKIEMMPSQARRLSWQEVPWAVILGVDGSGKTSVLKRLKQREDELPCKGIEVLHRRPGLVYKSQVNQGGLISHYSQPNHNQIKSVIKLFAMVLDWNYGYWRYIRKSWAAGYLLIADRHSLLDMLADPDRYRYGGPQGLAALALKLVPRPPMLFLLDAPEDVLQERKQELDRDQITRLRRGYLRIIRQQPGSIVIDSSQGVDDIVSDLVRVIASRLTHTASQV